MGEILLVGDHEENWLNVLGEGIDEKSGKNFDRRDSAGPSLKDRVANVSEDQREKTELTGNK